MKSEITLRQVQNIGDVCPLRLGKPIKLFKKNNVRGNTSYFGLNYFRNFRIYVIYIIRECGRSNYNTVFRVSAC